MCGTDSHPFVDGPKITRISVRHKYSPGSAHRLHCRSPPIRTPPSAHNSTMPRSCILSRSRLSFRPLSRSFNSPSSTSSIRPWSTSCLFAYCRERFTNFSQYCWILQTSIPDLERFLHLDSSSSRICFKWVRRTPDFISSVLGCIFSHWLVGLWCSARAGTRL